VSTLLSLVQRQHEELERRGPVPAELTSAYQKVVDVVGQWGVAWVETDGGKGQQREGGQQLTEEAPFHINTIIDIPLITSAGMFISSIYCVLCVHVCVCFFSNIETHMTFLSHEPIL
jgi:hypothetical protein